MYESIYNALFEIIGFFNRPHHDKELMKRAGVSLDAALFPLLMRIELYGALGIVELAAQVGRDHSTVSRQVDKLVTLGLVVVASVQPADKRVRQVALTENGQATVKAIADARWILMREALQDWNEEELEELKTSFERLAGMLRIQTEDKR